LPFIFHFGATLANSQIHLYHHPTPSELTRPFAATTILRFRSLVVGLMPHKPKINFSEGVLQKMAQYATQQISRAELINYLHDEGTDNPEQFIRDREPLFSAIRSVIDHYQEKPPLG